jgi:TolB protein
MTENRRVRRLPSARTHVTLTVVALALSAVPASALAARTTPAARPRPSAVVPWSKAGPGWTVAEYSASTAPGVTPVVKGATTLYLTSPQGAKYPFYTWPVSYTGPAYTLVDWSGDRQRVLVAAINPSSGKPTPLEEISLATGKVIAKFTLPFGVLGFSYTRPSGLNVLALSQLHANMQVVRYDLTGTQQLVLASGKGLTGAIDSPDGTSVIVGTSSGLEQVANSGGGTPTLFPAPVPVTGCAPVRWWNANTVLAWCNAEGVRYYPRLWLFPVSGAKATALSPQREGHGPDYGDIAAWRLSTGRLYLQAEGVGCARFIGWQWRDETLHAIPVPVTSSVDQVVIGFGASLLVRAEAGCPGGYSLLWLDPITSAIQYVLHPPANVAGVIAVVPFGRPSTS